VITIYGASDDCLEIEGDLREEFTIDCEAVSYLGCSDGTLIKVTYDTGGQWILRCVRYGADAIIERKNAQGSDAKDRKDGSPGYSDVIYLKHHIDWIVFGKGTVRP